MSGQEVAKEQEFEQLSNGSPLSLTKNKESTNNSDVSLVKNFK